MHFQYDPEYYSFTFPSAITFIKNIAEFKAKNAGKWVTIPLSKKVFQDAEYVEFLDKCYNAKSIADLPTEIKTQIAGLKGCIMRQYLEKILDGRLVPWADSTKNTLVRQIENKKEFDKMPNESRGIIVNKKLYMLTNPKSDVTHTALNNWLYEHHYIYERYDYNRFDILLMVQKLSGNLYLGESYAPWEIKNKKNIIKSQIDSINYLGIKVIPKRITSIWTEEKFENSKFEKMLVSQPLRKIKGKIPKYQKPWTKMLSKANGTYTYIGEENENQKRGAIIPYCVENDEIYIALMKPSDPKYGGSSFQIAKGLQEPEEDIKQTAIREGEQELGLKIPSNIQLLWNNTKKGMTYFYVKVNKVELKPQSNEDGIMETAEAKWFKLSEVEKIIRDWQKPIIKMLIRRLGI